MDPKLLYWTGAFANMGVVLVLAVLGVRRLRAGEVARHRLSMLTAGALVVAFLVSYVFKVTFLGKEDLSVWSAPDRWILWTHEFCVATLLLSGGFAAWRGRALRRSRRVTRNPEDPVAPAAVTRQHRAAGKVALLAVGLGFLTAAFVLLGMFRRAGLV
ncbi:MAG: DUF420 domain-containing protein [Myxococcales bacterium]|nr:DUF420 domain-containing protein [Myxococcales bacterium]